MSSDEAEKKKTPEPEEARGVKRSSNGACNTEIQSVNDWEHADIEGDDSRKSKFLRLMGANKKEHRGRFVIGDKKQTSHGRSCTETTKLTEDIEGQYRQGLDFKLSGGSRSHKGLGFHSDDTPDSAQQTPADQTDVQVESAKDEDTTGNDRSPNRKSEDLKDTTASTGSVEKNSDESNERKQRTDIDKANFAYGFVKSSSE